MHIEIHEKWNIPTNGSFETAEVSVCDMPHELRKK